MLLERLLKNVPKKYHYLIKDIRAEGGLIDDCKYIVEFTVDSEVTGNTYPVRNFEEAYQIVKDIHLEGWHEEFQIQSSNIWVVRTIDLVNVAYSDSFFKTRLEAEEEIRNSIKFISYSDLIIKLNIPYTNQNVKMLTENEAGYFYNENLGEVVYKR